MQLLVIRHAIAEDGEAFAATGRDDSERPLTPEGREKMRSVVSGLLALVPAIDRLASSPYVRAIQTAEIVAAGYGLSHDDITVVDALVPDAAPPRFVSWVKRQARADLVAVVGHEPHLGQLVTWLMSGLRESRVELKKGGACLLEFDEQPASGIGVLRWLMTAGQLRELGR